MTNYIIPFQTKFNSHFILTLAFIFTSAFVLTGCDCVQSADGIIIDKQTKLPIDNVSIATVDILKNTLTGSVEYSTKDGHFKFSKISGGIRQCPDLTLYFFERGYKQTSFTFTSYSTNDTIYLVKN